MILSVLHIPRSSFKALCEDNGGKFDTYTIHKLVYSLFPKEKESGRDFLFSEDGGDFYERRIMILSKRYPGSSIYGVIESKEVPEGYLEYSDYCFEIIVNPVKRVADTSKLVPIKDRNDIISWFIDKSSKNGFTVDKNSLLVSDLEVVSFNKDNHKVIISKANISGKLHVSDRGLFEKAFESGIGRGRAFGFGMLRISPIVK